MNVRPPEEMRRIEAMAAKISGPLNRASFLHKETGLAWLVCIVWAQFIRMKFNLVNGDQT